MSARTILLIDDDEMILRIARVALAKVGGSRALLATSGAEGLALAAAESPDVIVLDVMMPGMDGPATLERLRADAATRLIPVVFLTAKARPEDVESLLALGAAGVVTKPFDPMTLHAEILALVERSARLIGGGPSGT